MNDQINVMESIEHYVR